MTAGRVVHEKASRKTHSTTCTTHGVRAEMNMEMEIENNLASAAYFIRCYVSPINYYGKVMTDTDYYVRVMTDTDYYGRVAFLRMIP